jgi:broad specificity phosphatase PhoE
VVQSAARAARGGDLVVVTHGLVCHSLVRRRLSLAPPLEPPAGFANTGLTIIDPEPPWRVVRVNCTVHLDAALDEGLRA